MTPQDSHSYHLKLEWSGDRSGVLSNDDVPPLEVAPPPEFFGRSGVWTPEHLLVAASASCLMITFLAIAANSKLAVSSFRLEVNGRINKSPSGGFRFTEITLIPEIGIAEEDLERAKRLLEKAEKGCLITKSLQATVFVEPRFVYSSPAVTR